VQPYCPPAEAAADLLDELQLWREDVAADLTPSCSALFHAHARISFTPEDALLSIRHLSSVFSDAKLPRSSAAAICCMIAAVVSAAGSMHVGVLPDITELVGAALGVLLAKQGSDAHAMNLFLLSALHHAAVAQSCVVRIARAVVVHIPLNGLAHDGGYRDMLAGWVSEERLAVVQGVLRSFMRVHFV
jgi:hypothetical protein